MIRWGSAATRQERFELVVRLSCFGMVAVQWLLSGYSPQAWGIGHLHFLPRGTNTLLIASTSLILIGASWLPLSLRIPSWGGRIRPPIAALIAGAISLFTLWILKDSTHLLGDGGKSILDSVSSGPLPATEPLAAGAHRLAVRWGLHLGLSPVRALELWSCLLGALAISLVVYTGGIGRGESGLSITPAWLFLTGAIQLFFGYVESYPTACFFLLVYLALAVSVLAGRINPVCASLTLGMSLACHVGTGLLVPAHIYLLWLIAKRKSRKVLAASIVATPILPLLTVMFAPITSKVADARLIMPLKGSYSLLSADHVFDLLNELLLIVPLVIPLIILVTQVPRISRTTRDATTFLSIAALGGLLFAVVIDPALGMARDWDLLALGFLPLSSLLWHAAAETEIGTRTRLMIIVTAAVLVAPWIATNHDERASVARFRAILALSSERPGTAYGYETLGVYFRERNEPEAALDAFASALRAFPGYERYRLQLRSLVRSMEPAAAHEALTRIASADSSQDVIFELALLEIISPAGRRSSPFRLEENREYELRLEAGKALMHYRRYREAVEQFEQAITLGSDPAARGEAFYLRGLAQIGTGECSMAIESIERAKQLGWLDPDMDFHLGYGYFKCNEWEEAVRLLSAFLREHPASRYAPVAERIIGRDFGDKPEGPISSPDRP